MIRNSYNLKPFAKLSGAHLNKANLKNASLCHADLNGAYLNGAKLDHADLAYANLTGAYLNKADLSWAKLIGADLSNADLWGANLDLAFLQRANFTNANLTNTCLDPNNLVPECDLSEFETEGDFIIGYRTSYSKFVGNIKYEPGEEIVAPYFSTSDKICHPGIFLATLKWLADENYLNFELSNCGLAQVKALASEVHKVGNKFRAKRVWVMA